MNHLLHTIAAKSQAAALGALLPFRPERPSFSDPRNLTTHSSRHMARAVSVGGEVDHDHGGAFAASGANDHA